MITTTVRCFLAEKLREMGADAVLNINAYVSRPEKSCACTIANIESGDICREVLDCVPATLISKSDLIISKRLHIKHQFIPIENKRSEVPA